MKEVNLNLWYALKYLRKFEQINSRAYMYIFFRSNSKESMWCLIVKFLLYTQIVFGLGKIMCR